MTITEIVTKQEYFDNRIKYLFELLNQHQNNIKQRDAIHREIEQHKELLEKYGVYVQAVANATSKVTSNDVIHIIYGVVDRISMFLEWEITIEEIHGIPYVFGKTEIKHNQDSISFGFSKTLEDYNNYPFPRQNEVNVIDFTDGK